MDAMSHPGDLVMVGRLALAGVLGGLIGLERETHSQPAGLRTHMIVSLGACLIMLVSLYMAKLDPTRADPGRIAAQVVAGIGFLGAGAIMRFGMSVKGLTTAASLWTAAAIGLATGCGYWKAGSAATLFTLVALFFFDKIEKAFIKGRAFRRFVIHAKDAAGLVGHVEEAMEKSGISIKEVDIQRDLVEKKLQVTIVASCPENADVDVLSRAISAFTEVEKVEIE
jgi:putative Mg2+ transporter-C (MgtC) family protein